MFVGHPPHRESTDTSAQFCCGPLALEPMISGMNNACINEQACEEQEMGDWEACAVHPWEMTLPSSTVSLGVATRGCEVIINSKAQECRLIC